MTTCYYAPDPLQSTFFIPGGAVPGNGAQLFIYLAGSSTKTNVYKDSAGNTAWSNPIVMDSGGNLPSGGVIWIPTGITIKAVYAPSNDTDPPASPYRTIDNLAGINDVSAQTGVEWIPGPTPTFISATSFSVAGDQTATFTKGRGVKSTNTAGTVYSVVINSVYGASTTVTLAGGALDSGLSAVSYGLLDPANPSITFLETSRQSTSTLPASATTNIWGTDGNSVHITGTTAIGSFSTAPYIGAEKMVIFDSAVPLNYSSTIFVPPGAANMTTFAGDTAKVYADTTSKMLIQQYSKASGAMSNPNVLTSSLTANVGLSSTPAYFDGPQVAQGTTGIWFVSGTVTVQDLTGIGAIYVKLWDGTTTIASTAHTTDGAMAVSLSGYIKNPAGNLRMSCRDVTTTTGVIIFNTTGLSADSTITAVRMG